LQCSQIRVEHVYLS